MLAFLSKISYNKGVTRNDEGKRKMTRHSDEIERNCSRCGKELTDAASREHGVGPVCRRKTNDLHARQIPANLNVASALLLSLRKSDFHENCVGFSNNKSLFVRKMAAVANRTDDLTAVALSGEDFRPVVDWFDYGLSFMISSGTRRKVIEIIEALGYVGLGGVLRGDACMSPATLLVIDDTVQLSGKACTAGFRAMKHNIPGVRTPRYRGDSRPYVASVRHAEKFVALAMRHWPFIDCDPEEVLADAASAVEDLPAAEEETAQTVNNRPVARWGRSDLLGAGWFFVKTPWHGTRQEMTSMLDRFKQLPRGERKYVPNTRSWAFKDAHWNRVSEIVRERYTIYGS